MDLQNVLESKRGTRLLVNGTVYNIDKRGIVWNILEKDATKLLQNRNVWRIWDGGKTKPVTMPAPKVEIPAPKVTPILTSGSRIPEPEVAEPKPEVKEPEVEVEIEESTVEAESEEDEEWPDPTMTMKKSQLWEIADAYEVAYTDKTKKAALVKSIEKAMYPDGK